MIKLDDLRIRRGGRMVINGLSFNLAKGDFAALIGANGSGKTTVLRAIMGFVRFDSGELSLFGSRVSDFRRLRKRIGYIPQNIAMDYRMPISVQEVVAMGRFGKAGAGRRLTGADRDIIHSALHDAGLSGLAARPIGHLSGGELQKVQIARALCQQPELLLLDEPTSNLDLGAQHDCLELIAELHARYGLTTLVVMHDLAAIPPLCKRAIIIDDARKVFDGPLEEAFQESNLRHIYKDRSQHILEKLQASCG